jgi:hypothetical protein
LTTTSAPCSRAAFKPASVPPLPITLRPRAWRQLHSRDTDAAGRAVDQDRFARFRAGALEERAIRGAVRDAERGP